MLIVDEIQESREALARELAQWQVAADYATSSFEAIEVLERASAKGRPYDVALVDMSLQHTSGLSLAAMAKANGAAQATRIILLSTARSAADPVQRREAGVGYQLIKPVRPGDLYDCIARVPRAGASTATSPLMPQRPAQAPTTTRRRRVLLAEDNPVNVEVATAMLNAIGLEVQCARNGEEALQAVRSGTFELVLMDCQMPVMDGFAATAEIRRHEHLQGRSRKLPVVAITANALQGDRESCLAAGMDDYLSKPFTQQQLAAVIGRWIALPVAATVHHGDLQAASSAAAKQAVTPPSPPPAARTPQPFTARHDPINVHALENIRALSEERGESLMRRVVEAYVDDTPQHLQALRRAITGGDPDKLRSAAHSLKSSSANVGADAMAQLCREMESLGRSATTEGASGILTNMEKEFQAVRDSLTAILEKEA